jgi:cyclic pyranopterin phosphate synthase
MLDPIEESGRARIIAGFWGPEGTLSTLRGRQFTPRRASTCAGKKPPTMKQSAEFTHVTPDGSFKMVDVSDKERTTRTAVATGRVVVGPYVYRRVLENQVGKGDVLVVSQLAGIMGAKQTSRLIPLCHDVSLRGVDVELTLDSDEQSIHIKAFAKSVGPTGVEMEALTAVSVAALTVYDMCKSLSKDIQITGIQLLAKTGGASGDYLRTTVESHS